MALLAGAFLVTLSVSAAFGAAPAGTRDATRGQSIASFVHSLVFGDDEANQDGEEAPAEEELDEDELVDDADPLADPLDEPGEDLDEETGAHGACVSDVAQDKDAVGGPNENHGGAVSEAARETCWETDDADEGTDEEAIEEDEGSESHGACVSAATHDRDGSAESELKNHGKWVSQHARYICWGLEVPTDATDEDGEAVEGDATSADTDADGQAAKGNKPDKADRGTGSGSGSGRALGQDRRAR